LDQSNKTEKATPHKRREQRKKGEVFQSRDLISGIMILVAFAALRILVGHMLGRFDIVMNSFITLGASVHEIDTLFASNIMFELVINLLFLILPLLMIVMIFTIGVTIMQTRIGWTSELLKPKFSRLNPIQGIKNKMFSLRSVVELVKSILKIVAIVAVLYWAISTRADQIPNLLLLTVPGGASWIGNTIFTVALYAGVAMLIIGIADFVYQWWDHERKLMMSKKELKDEHKNLEGDPQIMAERRRIMRQRARERMMGAVKDADVVVRNPEHYAIAMKYDIEQHAAPVVIAKGRDYMALQIIKQAEAHGVYMVEDRPLARALYETVAIDMEVPQQFWAAMVEIIARVMETKGRDLNKLSADIDRMSRNQNQNRIRGGQQA